MAAAVADSSERSWLHPCPRAYLLHPRPRTGVVLHTKDRSAAAAFTSGRGGGTELGGFFTGGRGLESPLGICFAGGCALLASVGTALFGVGGGRAVGGTQA